MFFNQKYVYLINEEGTENYKIGVTKKDINKRIKELQTGNGSRLILSSYFVSDKPYKLESMLHRKYEDRKAEGEWFYFDGLNAKQEFMESCKFYQGIINTLKDNPYF